MLEYQTEAEFRAYGNSGIFGQVSFPLITELITEDEVLLSKETSLDSFLKSFESVMPKTIMAELSEKSDIVPLKDIVSTYFPHINPTAEAWKQIAPMAKGWKQKDIENIESFDYKNMMFSSDEEMKKFMALTILVNKSGSSSGAHPNTPTPIKPRENYPIPPPFYLGEFQNKKEDTKDKNKDKSQETKWKKNLMFWKKT